MKTIKYIGFYAKVIEDSQSRQAVLAATNKMDYIASALVRNGYQVEIISPGWTNHIKGFYSGQRIQLRDNVTLKNFFTFGSKIKVLRMFKYILSPIHLFLYLLKNTKKAEVVLVYHSIILTLPVLLAKKIKKFKLLLEVEEIYQDVKEFSKATKKIEYKAFEKADGYLLATELLNSKVNQNKKPSRVIYGTYQAQENRKSTFNDNRIHLVYSGSFGLNKGIMPLILAASYLTDNYHIHILGFGSLQEKEAVLQKIEEVNKEAKALITYDGLLAGEDFIQFLQKCQVGLCPRELNASFNTSAFPSKILTYLANGLRVLSVKIRAIELSPMGESLYYYTEQTPESIANAILSMDLTTPYDSRQLIKALDNEFVKQLEILIGAICSP